MSAITGEGLLRVAGGAEQSCAAHPRICGVFLVPHEASAVIARLHAVGQVIERDYEGEKAWFKARIPPHLHDEFAPYIIQELQLAGSGRRSPMVWQPT